MERKDSKDRYSHSSNHLITIIEGHEIMEDFEILLKLNEDVEENSKMTPSSYSGGIEESVEL